MYHNTMESEGRQKKVEAGREMFAAYLKKKNGSGQQGDQKKKNKLKDETQCSKEVSVAGGSLDVSPVSSFEDSEVVNLESSTKNNGTSTTLSGSKQTFEDGGEMSSDRFQTRLRELEDILCSKEAALEAALEELSALKEITSFDVSSGVLETDYKTRFEECCKRLLEFQEAVEHREGIINQLSSSLQQAIQTRDALQLQGDQLAQEVALLQRQLKATTELIQGHHWDTGIKPQDYLSLQNQVLALEAAVSRNESVISDLNYIIKEKESTLQSKSDELRKKSQELSQHKTKSASEIQNLMREVEELHQKCAIMASSQNCLILEHEGQMAALQAELEENFGLQLAQIKEELRNQFNREKEALEKKHVDEVALCQTASQSPRAGEEQTTLSKEQLESLHSQVQELSDAREKLVNEVAELKQSCVLEVDLLKQKISVLQEQLEGAAKEKQTYEQHVLESRKEIEKGFTMYKNQVEDLKFQLQEASRAEVKYSEQLHECRNVYEAELSSYKQSHEIELTLYKEQIDSLNLQLQEALKAEAEYSAKLIEYNKAREVELASYQQSHEIELSSYKQSAEALNLRLQEASLAEENFPKVLAAHKQSLESELCRYKEENEALNAELQRILNSEEVLRKEKTEILASHDVAVSSYEEQLATLKASLQAAEETVTYHQRELSSLKTQLKDKSDVNDDYVKEVKSCKEQVVTLTTQVEEALKYGEKCKQDFALYKKSHVEEISLIKDNFELEQIQRNSIARCQSHEAELALCKQQIDFLNSRLQDASEAEKCHIAEITACQIQLKEYKEQVDSLDRRFSEELMHAQEDFSKEINSKCLEIETLLARLQEASALEEKHRSQILSSQKEIENLNVQLQERAETEKISRMELVSYQEKMTAYSDEVQALKKMTASQDEMQTYKQQVKTLKESLHYELSCLQDSHSIQLKRIEEEHAVKIESFSNQVDDLTLKLAEVTTAKEILEKEKNTYHNLYVAEINEYKCQLEEFSAQLQENRKNEEKYVTDMSDCHKQLNSYKSQVELLNAKIQDDVSEIKISHAKEVNDLKDELQHLKNINSTLEAEVVCLKLAAKHRDDSSRAQLEEVTVQFLKTQSLLAAKEEVEGALESRINDLQIDLEKANHSIDHIKIENEQLQEMTVQYLKLEGLLAAKEEGEHMLREHIQELEEALCTVKMDSEQMNQDSCELTLKVAKATNLFKKLKYEKDELSEKYKHLQAERNQLASEKKMTEEKLKDVASQLHKLKTSCSVDENVLASSGSELPPATETRAGVVVTPLECASVIESLVSSGQDVTSGFDNTEVVNYSEDGDQISDSGPLKRRKRSTMNVPEPVSSFCSSKLLEKLIVFEREKIELANQLETLESKFQEKELQELLYIEESSVAKLHCKELEDKLLQLEKVRIERDTILEEKSYLESKVVDLEHENTTFRNLQTTLNTELAKEKIATEDRLHQLVKQRLENVIDEKNCTAIENLFLDLGNKAKEVVFLKEKMRSQEQTLQLLNEKILILEKSKGEYAKKINLYHEELARVRSELEESWKQHNATKEELGACRKELAVLCMQKEQCESSRSRLLQMKTSHTEITPVCASSQEELHSMLKELEIEVETLKSSLEDEKNHNEKLTLELEMVQKSDSAAVHSGVTDVNSNASSDSGMLELQHKLELILRSNTELVAEKESLLDKLKNQQQYVGMLQRAGGYEQVESWMSNLDKQQSDLMAELRAYREQHTSLAELVGSTGVLQETLYRQKHELLQKFEEMNVIKIMLENEREELKSAQLKIQMMEHQMLEKDNIFQELTRQKRLLEQDLHEIEDRLRDQEDRLQTQKLALEAEIRDRDLRIRHWQLELRAKQVEVSSARTLEGFDQQSDQSTVESDNTGEQERLELMRSQLEEVHKQAVARLKLYLEEQFTIRETELQKNFMSEVHTLKQQHTEQLMSIQQQLDAKAKEVEALLNSELHSQLGISQNLVTRLEAEGMAAIKEKQRNELDNMKNNFDEHHTEIYSVLKQKFDKFAEQQIAIALKVIQHEHESVHQQRVSNLIMKHTEELKVLQAKLESQRQEELLLLRQDLNKKHNDELNEVTKGLKLEISLLKRPHDGKSSRSSVHQLKQEMCMEYTSTLKGWVQTWYSDCQEQLEALNRQIYEVWQQEESQCQQSDADGPGKISVTHIDIRRLLEGKEQLLAQAEVLHTEVAKHHMGALHSLQTQLDAEHSKLVEKVEHMKRTVQEGTTIASLQDQISKLTAEKEELQDKHKLAVDLLSHEHSVEVAKLRDLIANVKCGSISGLTELRQEMEAKHAKEMEELRQYFEQKCADVEKHYSEEVFSQHSRKLSGSSSGLENEELVSDMYYTGGDHGQRLTALTHICDSYSVEPSFKDLEEHYRIDFEKRLVEYRDQLESVKLEMEVKYQNEMEVLREEYESKVEDLVRDLSNTHKTEIQNIELKHAKEIQNLKEKLQLESAKELSNVHLECTNEIQKVQKEMADEYRKELGRMKDMFEKELKRQIESLTYNMKQEEEDHVAAMQSELLNKHVKHIQKLEDSIADHVDKIGRTNTDVILQKVNVVQKVQMDVKQQCEEEYKNKLTELRSHMQEKYAKELEATIEAERKLMTEQFDELTAILKKSAEEEQDKFMTNQKEMMSDFVRQHQQDVQALKIQHEASIQAVQEECQRLWEVQIQQLKDKHKQEIGALQEEIARFIQEKNTCRVQVMNVATSAVSADETYGTADLDSAAAREMTTLHTIQHLQYKIKDKDAKFASAIAEMKEMHESELDQVRALCERRLHDEVEQAKHDISRSLEEQIQALLSNDCKDTPRPKELIELEEKFAIHYKQEIVILKEQHAKEVAQLKADYETELQSLTKKFSEDIAVLEGQMAAETTKHELEKCKIAMQIKLEGSSDQGTENVISILHADLEQLIKERDNLKKMTVTLRCLLGELVAYFTVCEDELNSTLIGELLRVEPEEFKNSMELRKNISEVNGHAFSSVTESMYNECGNNTEAKRSSNSVKNLETFSLESTVTSPQENDISVVQDQVTCDEVSIASHHLDQSLVPIRQSSSSAHVTHRVHFAPDASSINSLIDEDNLLDCIEGNKDLSMNFRSELDSCLKRLKAEAIAVLGLSGTLPKTVQITRDAVMLLEEKVNILTNQLAMEVKEKDELMMQLENSQRKERERAVLQDHLKSLETMQEVLESDLKAARTRVTELESELGKMEDVTEGFGESIQPSLTRRLHNMAELQDKARSVLSKRTAGDHKSPHLQLIEELCQEGDRLSEEARKKHDDLKQQVEAADKQLRATRLFLEEQAAEREQERDDFLREIAKLQEQIHERDHDHNERERLTKEVESLELQVKEAAALQKDFDIKREELETELKAAVDKIWVLRDIIGELESQVETKTQHEAAVEQQLCELHAILEQQSRTHQELAEELNSLRLDSGKSELTEHISHLEEQLQKHRLHVEQFHSNSTALRQMKAQLRDLEAAVDKKTKDLESYHATVSSASCSSPSEDVSIREQLDAFRCDTPEEARNTQSPVCLPLDELHRLQDKLQRHSRAEEVALKRIRDLEMQLKGVKKNEEDVVAERDALQEYMEKQLLKISALQSRLDEQRQKTDSQKKEANSELQTKVCDQEKEFSRLRETIETRDQEVKELKTTLQETRRIMMAQEKEWHTKANEELETIEKLTETCKKLKAEKRVLERSSQMERMFGPRDEMRFHKSNITEGFLSLDRDDVLYTSPREVFSGSEVDHDNSYLKTILNKKDSEIMSLKNQLANVNVMLEQHVTENAEVALTLSRLTGERQRLQARIKDLEEQLKTAHRSQVPAEMDSVHMEFAAERTLWAQEKAALKLALAQAEADAIHGSRIGEGADITDRVKHLFGKYLRSESYRKALVWQKRYLLVVLGGYQESEAITVSRLAHLSGVQEAMLHQQHSVSQKKPRTRFKTAAIVMIALSRMRYLVQRWRLGRRVGSSAVLSRGCSESTLSSAQSSYHGPRRHGSSTSVSSLGICRAPAQEYDVLMSPPSRDRPMLQRWETDFVQHHVRSTEGIPVSPLRPYHVAEYVDRFDELQRNLGLSLTKSPP